MGLFSKLKDYNLELDEVLDKKTFSSHIKNLLLNMIYKVEVSYPDFKEVKRCVRNREDLLNEIVETVRLYCENIKIAEPDSDQAKMLIKHKVEALTNENERSILTYPTEMSLFYAISDISPKYFYINQDIVLKSVLQNTLVNGYNLNNVEILRDFNGWSWDFSCGTNFNYIDNLIYQNLLVIFGEKFLYEWRTYGSTRRDFIDEAKKYIKIFTGNDKFFKALFKVLYVKLNAKEHEKIDLILAEKMKEYKLMQDKEKFISTSKEKKEKLEKKLGKIDFALSDSVVLEKEFKRFNAKVQEDKQIKSIVTYKKRIIAEREKIFNQINDITYLLISSNYNKRKNDLKDNLEHYKTKDDINTVIIELQKEFLNFLDKKLSKMKTRDELIDVLYELRYYRQLKIDKNHTTCEIEELDILIDKIMKKTITMLCKIGAMKILSMDIGLNFEIIKYALSTKIIELEQIKISYEIDNDSIIIRIFDKDTIEKQGRKQLKVSKGTFEIKPKRKIKLFN